MAGSLGPSPSRRPKRNNNKNVIAEIPSGIRVLRICSPFILVPVRERNIEGEPPRNRPLTPHPTVITIREICGVTEFLFGRNQRELPSEETAREEAGAVQGTRTWQSLLRDLRQSWEDEENDTSC